MTAGQHVSVCSFSLLPHCLQPEWAWFHSDKQSQRDRRVGSLGHCGFKASFTDGLCGVRGLALTVSNVIYFHISLCASAFSTSLGRSAGALMPLSADRHADLFKEFKELQVSDR